MPSLWLKNYLRELVLDRKEKFDDDFDEKWNTFGTLCLIRTEKCLQKKSEDEKHFFKDFFMDKCRTKSEKICFFLKDRDFQEDVEIIFQDFLKDSDISNGNKKSAVVSRHFLALAKRNIDDPEKAIDKYNMVSLIFYLIIIILSFFCL